MSAMINPEHLEHLDGLQRLKGFPTNEDSAVSVAVRYFADPVSSSTVSEKLLAETLFSRE
jgi:hypothetical protein